MHKRFNYLRVFDYLSINSIIIIHERWDQFSKLYVH